LPRHHYFTLSINVQKDGELFASATKHANTADITENLFKIMLEARLEELKREVLAQYERAKPALTPA
jgi:hypothetical protein